MNWPTPQDYNEAIQHPRSCFSDGELQRADVWLTPLGLPRPITGNFATVYRLSTGGKDWAIRCFWREVPDLHHRYGAISKHLKSARLPYTVGFEYLQEGIRVRGTWYPAIKMEWIEGDLLLDYVHQNLHRPAALAELSERWVHMCERLERAQLAHGDLQHGNVLVTGGELKLIDYDGMYVPALAGRSCQEIGHQNYQHPARSAAYFGPGLDRFSQWLVYVCLLALTVDPSLWSATGAGDERLLLGVEDMRRPERSPAFQLLLAHPEPGVRSAARGLYEHLSRDPLDIPPLTPAVDSRHAGRTESILTVRGSIGRLARFVPSVGEPAESSSAAPEWVVEMIQRANARRFDPIPGSISRSVRAAGCLMLAAVLYSAIRPGWAFIALGAALVVTTLLLVAIRLTYCLDDGVCERRTLAAERRAASRSLVTVERLTVARERARRRLEVRYRRRVEALATSRSRHEARAATRQLALSRMLEDSRAVVLSSIVRLEQQLGQDLERTLTAVRDREVDAVLRQRRLWSAAVESLDRRLRAGLWLTGIRSAADVTPERLHLLTRSSPETRRAVARWRAHCERDARAAAPSELPAHISAARKRPFEKRVQGLELALIDLAATREAIARSIEERLVERFKRIDEEIAGLDVELGTRLEELEREMTGLRGDQLRGFWQVKQLDEELRPFESLTFRSYLECVVAASLNTSRAPGLRLDDGDDQPYSLWPVRRRLRQ